MATLNFDRSTVKHAIQNTQNDCYQRLSYSYSFTVHQAYSAPPDPLAGLTGALLLKRKGREGMEEEGKGREGIV